MTLGTLQLSLDNVGDNVGDVAGMGADLFDSYVASVAAVMILGVAIDSITGSKGLFVQIPLVFAGLGILAAVIGTLTVRVGKKGNPGKALNMGTYVTCIIFAVLTLVASVNLQFDLRIWGAAVVGLIAGVIIGITSDYFTSEDKAPVLKTAEASETGPAVNIITGFSYGLRSIIFPLIGIAAAAAISYKICEPLGQGYAVYGIALAALGMLVEIQDGAARESLPGTPKRKKYEISFPPCGKRSCRPLKRMFSSLP
jgi:K(+)-stimulated pyrophosphate-energized sodium pump